MPENNQNNQSIKVLKYTGIEDINAYWIEHIAPNYFDFELDNNYRTGIFGYVNSIIGESVEDAFNAIAVSRREFYPNTAQFTSSIYDMAIMQKMNLPTAHPATARGALLLPLNEIIENSTYSNGIYTYILDNTLKFMADDIPFMFDYPIIILSRDMGNKNFTHTIYYDTENNYSPFVTSSNQYIANRPIIGGGTRYILLGINYRQSELTMIPKLITKDFNIASTSVDVSFTGILSAFEVYYKSSSDNADIIRIPKIPKGGGILQGKYVEYEMIDEQKIRIIFPKNPYFTPEFNSEIIVYVYTTLGIEGNFEQYDKIMDFTIGSEKYPYNDSLTVIGKISGESRGGKDKPTKEIFQNEVQLRYITNDTFTTERDLQAYFDTLSLRTQSERRTKIQFRKRRDDALYRLFGAFSLLKDPKGNVIHTNTLTMRLFKSDIDNSPLLDTNRCALKPGTIFKYIDPNINTPIPIVIDKDEKIDISGINYDVKIAHDLIMVDDLAKVEDNEFLFINPYLTVINISPNLVGFFLNSINEIRAIEYSYTNSNAIEQFLGNTFKIERNALMGENFYKLSVTISPASGMPLENLLAINQSTISINQYRAKMDGIIESIVFIDGELRCTLKYVDTTSEVIILNNYAIKISDGEYEYFTGYKLNNLNIGSHFIQNDIIAFKRVTDLGKFRSMVEIRGAFDIERVYIPMYISDIVQDDHGNEVAILHAYISTDDIVASNLSIQLTGGICNSDGTFRNSMTVPNKNMNMDINVFYKDDNINHPHKYSLYDYFKGYTLSNTYSQNENNDEDKITLIKQIDFIRSYIDFDGATNTIPGDFGIVINNVPMVRASWVKHYENFTYLINQINKDYELLSDAFFQLENAFGIVMTFYNTYGKSRFFTVGLEKERFMLNKVNTSWKFGIYLNTISLEETFQDRFVLWLKEYVERIDYASNTNESIYILRLVSEAQKQFAEIGYMEYYGFNIYDTTTQKIEIIGKDELTFEQARTYVPEFTNIDMIRNGDGNYYPKVELTFLSR